MADAFFHALVAFGVLGLAITLIPVIRYEIGKYRARHKADHGQV